MTYEEFIARFEKHQKTAKGVMVRCPSHEDSTASLAISKSSDGGVLVRCFAGCATESVVNALGLRMSDLFASEQQRQPPAAKTPHNSNGAQELPKPVIEKIYTYTDEIGREIFQVVRLNPKGFRQRHSTNGAWVWNMDGVERVLYRLPEVHKSESVWVCEGEKDADSLSSLGLCGTCNVGGAGKWLDGYTESLKGKDVSICGDNDDAGQKHVQIVFDSISKAARSVRLIKVPEFCKDITDYISTFGDSKKAESAVIELFNASVPHVGGVRMPVYSMADIEPWYKKQIEQSSLTRLDLGSWLPSLRFKLRPIIPGEVVLVLGDTGAGKTALLQQIAMSGSLPTLLFEMELPPELLYERFFAMKSKLKCVDVETEYRNGIMGSDSVMAMFPKLFICPESKLTVEQLESIILKSELKMGCKPVLVLIDYVQLFKAKGERYERTSDNAEAIKIIAKTTKTIIVMASQVARREEGEIGLHSGKDSGALC